MNEAPPKIQSRPRRLRTYLAYNRDRILTDLLVMLTWVIASWTVFGMLSLPRWLFYVVLFIGVIVYSRITPPWERPYRSPDLDPNEQL